MHRLIVIKKIIILSFLLPLAACDQWKRLTGLQDTPIFGSQSNPPANPALEDHLIVLSGQSNMMGIYDVYPWVLQPNVKLLTGDDAGPGVYACNLIAAAHPKWRVLCLQTEVGGTAIATWMPGAVNYVRMMGLIQQYAPGKKIDALIWYQGESDARGTLDPNWNAEFTTIVAQWRADLGQQMPIIWTELGAMGYTSVSDQANWDQFKLNQEQLTITAPSIMVKADGAPTAPGGGVHLNQEGHIIVGTRYAAAFETLGKFQ